MKERPILMSAPMVRAILAGRKTQTRRVVNGDVNGYEGLVVGTVAQERGHLGMHCFIRGDESVYQHCLYGEPGDRLWVRERHCLLEVTKSALSRFPLGPQNGNEVGPDVWNVTVEYSDGTENETSVEGEKPKQTRERGETKWRPGIHMPRWACRLVLEITKVRVERLLDITVEDSFAEGIEPMRCPKCHLACYGLPGWGHDDVQKTPIEAYWHLWDQINEARGYGRAKNPWVWVVEFRRA